MLEGGTTIGLANARGLTGVQRTRLTALLQTLEEHDSDAASHSGEVMALAGELAAAMGQSGRDRTNTCLAALLHDVGKALIAPALLSKPGPLSPAEMAVMRSHAQAGGHLVDGIPGLSAVANAVRHSHERFDGNGYPDGLAGDQIPLGARIVAVCDAYHAMVSDRPYSPAQSPRYALSELHGGSGTQFDPQVVAVAHATLSSYQAA